MSTMTDEVERLVRALPEKWRDEVKAIASPSGRDNDFARGLMFCLLTCAAELESRLVAERNREPDASQ